MSTHSLTLVDRFASEGTEGVVGRGGRGVMVTNGDDGDSKWGCMGVGGEGGARVWRNKGQQLGRLTRKHGYAAV